MNNNKKSENSIYDYKIQRIDCHSYPIDYICRISSILSCKRYTFIDMHKWNGTHVRTYQPDRLLKKIAFDKAGGKLVALAANEQGGRDVVLYSVE